MPKEWSEKRERQYEHIKEGYKEEGDPHERGEAACRRDGEQGAPRARRDQAQHEALTSMGCCRGEACLVSRPGVPETYRYAAPTRTIDGLTSSA